MNPIREAMATLTGHWHQGSMYDMRGNACGLGHLMGACRGKQDYNYYDDASVLMGEVAQEQYPERVLQGRTVLRLFARFNDHPNTTEEDVLRVMEKAAVRWEETEGLTH